MPSFRRKASSIDELRMQVLLAYGPEARITDATRVTRKGLGRFFAHEEIEATVVVPDDAAPAGGVAVERVDRVGIAALLADADEGDGGRTGGSEARADASEQRDAAGDAASTASRSFAALLADVERALGGPGSPMPPAGHEAVAPPAHDAARGRPGPIALGGPAAAAALASAPGLPLIADRASPGDFVLVVGLGDDATTAARGLIGQTAGSPLLLHGRAADAVADIADRRAALTARMRAVERDGAIVLAVSVELEGEFGALAELRPDEVWAAVDVSRRTDDTAHWLSCLDAAAPVAALAAVGSARTRHPLDLSRFGWRIGWQEASAGIRRA